MASRTNPNLVLLKHAISELGTLTDQLVFVGGITTFLHVPASLRDLRATLDVDVIIDSNRVELAKFEASLRKRGFMPDTSLICRHLKGSLVIDVLPLDPNILGFSNSWYLRGFAAAEKVKVDGHGSKDLEDIVAVSWQPVDVCCVLLSVDTNRPSP